MDRQTNGQMVGWKHEQTDGRTVGWAGGWVMDGWMNKKMEAKMDGCYLQL